MSALTKEEMESVNMCREWGEEYPDLIRIIDRLMAENEELRGKLCKSDIGRLECMTKLTALVEAAEPFKKLYENNWDDDMGMCPTWIHDVKLSMFRNLNKAVKEAKG